MSSVSLSPRFKFFRVGASSLKNRSNTIKVTSKNLSEFFGFSVLRYVVGERENERSGLDREVKGRRDPTPCTVGLHPSLLSLLFLP